MKDPDLFTQGVIDMCVETMFLAVVSHPHIITMRAFQRKIAQAQQIWSNFLNTVNNRKLTIIAKIRETHTRFLQPTRSECL
jgi:hypothetical protein